ncbi:MAG: YihY/virulence factor BrkB family protein [Cardiobacteriaceae bacterium]|nr:YihY/virulence factor BrkB family protein [Cardiobacteriaceae bacterium]
MFPHFFNVSFRQSISLRNDFWFTCWRYVKQKQVIQTLDAYSKILVFTTLMTLVPLLAVAFALLRGFGFNQVLEPWLYGLFKPMGAEGEAIVHYLLQFVAQADVQSLGAVGVVFLLFSVQRLRQQLSAALDRLWQVEEKRLSLVDLISTIGFIVLVPLFLGALMQGLPLWLSYQQWLSDVLRFLGLWGLISALYYYLPHASVRLKSALLGGALFTLCWLPLSSLFALFMRYSSSYSILYSSFASLMILLLWLHSIWWLFLLGAQLSVWIQHPPRTQSALHPEQIAYDALAHIELAFHRGENALSLSTLSQKAQISPQTLAPILQRLIQQQLLTQTTTQCYQLAFSPEHYTLKRIAKALYPENEASHWWLAEHHAFYQQNLRQYREKRFAAAV